MIDIRTIIRLRIPNNGGLERYWHRYILMSKNKNRRTFICGTSQKNYLIQKDFDFVEVDVNEVPNQVFTKKTYLNTSQFFHTDFDRDFVPYNQTLNQYLNLELLPGDIFQRINGNLNIKENVNVEQTGFIQINNGVLI